MNFNNIGLELNLSVSDAEEVELLHNLQEIAKKINNASDNLRSLDCVSQIINKLKLQRNLNQVTIGYAFRIYYRLLQRTGNDDKILHSLMTFDTSKVANNHNQFTFLFIILSINHQPNLDANYLINYSIDALPKAISERSPELLTIVKLINLLCKKYDINDINVELHHVYYLLQQTQIVGMRESTLTLFTFITNNFERAKQYFTIIHDYWPWTNKNKFYLLSCILNNHSFVKLQLQCGFDKIQFYKGLQLALSYKNLFACSQYLVKSLSNQDSKDLLYLAAEILLNGTNKEIDNFYTQWADRIYQRNDLFELVKKEKSFYDDDDGDDHINFRTIYLITIFSKQIICLSQDIFDAACKRLIENWKLMDSNSQLLIFNLLSDNLSYLLLDTSLAFFIEFIKRHKCVENSRFRNNILNKLTLIINFTSKIYNKEIITSTSPKITAIRTFYQEIQTIINADIFKQQTYQLRIFSLKLLENLIRTIYAPNVQKNAKNCNIQQNQQMGKYLITKNIFDGNFIIDAIFRILKEPRNFDDARDLMITILDLMKCERTEESAEVCKEFCRAVDIDECNIASRYAVVTLNSCATTNDWSIGLKLFDECFCYVKENLNDFQMDPLYFCNTSGHLFGYLNVINRIILGIKLEYLTKSTLSEIVDLISSIIDVILKMLNSVNNEESSTAASFQDMDESLEKLVIISKYKSTKSHDDLRKFLLLSFWLTLKACCDTATSVGCILQDTTTQESDNSRRILEKCLEANVNVLLRCRHKGAIEAAGVSIGKLVKKISRQKSESKDYKLLFNCLDQLFDDVLRISTTRRGAGLSLMFLNLIKNENQCQQRRPLLNYAIQRILDQLANSAHRMREQEDILINCDKIDALIFHYLCVLVKDADLRDHIAPFFDDIMIAALTQIEHNEWTVCNAAFQLFGALVSKIVGQKQSTDIEQDRVEEDEKDIKWETKDITYAEIFLQLPKTCDYILNCLNCIDKKAISTRLIILFVGFLSNVDHFHKNETENCIELEKFRNFFWNLLSHNCEKVRKLAAKCFVRAHDRIKLTEIILNISNLKFSEIQNENFLQGLILMLVGGVNKITHESQFIVYSDKLDIFFIQLRNNLKNNFNCPNDIKPYTLSIILDLFLLCDFDENSPVVLEIISKKTPKIHSWGEDIWLEKLKRLKYNKEQ